MLWFLHLCRQRKRSEPPPLRRPGRTSDGHCPVHPPHTLTNSSVELGSPNMASHCSPRGLLQNRNLNTDSPERRRRPGHGSLTNISRHDSLKKIDSPPIRRSTSSGQYPGFNDHKPLDPESIAQVGLFSLPWWGAWSNRCKWTFDFATQSLNFHWKAISKKYPTFWHGSLGQRICVKGSWVKGEPGGIKVAKALKWNNFQLYWMELSMPLRAKR